MAFEVIDGEQRLVRSHCQRFAAHQPDHHTADQPRPGSRGDRVDIVKTNARLAHHPRDHRGEPLGMGASCDFGNDPPYGACSAS